MTYLSPLYEIFVQLFMT